jgi:nucleoid-associated protein YgaU
MKTMLRVIVVATTLVVVLLADLALLVPDAHAIFGVWRRAGRRMAVVGTVAVASTAAVAAAGATAAAASESAAAQQQAGAAQQQAAAAQHQAAAAQQQAARAQQQAAAIPPPATAGKELPLGTVVPMLPAGCVTTPVGVVEYYYCGGNFYRAVFQGNSLVYVTARP